MARINSRFHPKLTDSAISILYSKNIHTVFHLVSEDSDKLMHYSGLTYQEVLDLKREITKLYIGMRKGSELLSAVSAAILTGIKSVDILLKGGLRSGQIYEICGLSGSGKTQLAHTVAVNIAATPAGVVHYIDAKGDFSGKRSLTIITSKKLAKNIEGRVLENIRVTRTESIEELMNFLHSLKPATINSDIKSLPKLVVIDSLPALFFDTSNYSDSRSTLHHFANILRYISTELNAIVITINLISQWRDTDMLSKTAFGNAELVSKPFLGKHWLSVPSNRLIMETRNEETRKLTVTKSSYMECGSSCYVSVTNLGVV